MALLSSSMGVGGGLALPAAALVAQHADWHILFYGAAGLGAVAIGLTLVVVPESPVRAKGSFDLPGALGLSLGLVLFLLPITKGGSWGWFSATTLGLFAASVLTLLLWGALELRVRAPLVDLRTMMRRELLVTNLVAITVGFAFYVITLAMPQLLQLPTATGFGLGQSMIAAGLWMAPLGLMMICMSPVYARLSAKFGPAIALAIGLAVIAIGYAAGLALMSTAWQTAVTSVVVGAGVGLAYSALPTLIVTAVDASETSAANGLNTLMRYVGMAVSSAVIGTVLAESADTVGGVEMPTMDGFRISFIIAAAAIAIGLLLTTFLARGRSRRR
jgi:MFS family permease